MIAVKDAVAAAMVFATDLLDLNPIQLRLEEVEETAGKWLITLSMPGASSLTGLTGLLSQRREYKTFAVDGETGKVLSMKIRELAGTE